MKIKRQSPQRLPRVFGFKSSNISVLERVPKQRNREVIPTRRIMIHPAGPARFDREIGIAFAKHGQRWAVRRVPVCLTPVGHEVEPRRPFVIVDLTIVNAVIAHTGRAFRASATLHSQH